MDDMKIELPPGNMGQNLFYSGEIAFPQLQHVLQVLVLRHLVGGSMPAQERVSR